MSWSTCGLWCSNAGGGKVDPEAACFAIVGCHACAAAHPFRSLLDNSKADASSGIFIHGVKPLKYSENFIQTLGANADSVVLHPEPHGSRILLAPDLDSRCFAGLHEFQRVGEQIGKDQIQSGLEGNDRVQCGETPISQKLPPKENLAPPRSSRQAQVK